MDNKGSKNERDCLVAAKQTLGSKEGDTIPRARRQERKTREGIGIEIRKKKVQQWLGYEA